MLKYLPKTGRHKVYIPQLSRKVMETCCPSFAAMRPKVQRIKHSGWRWDNVGTRLNSGVQLRTLEVSALNSSTLGCLTRLYKGCTVNAMNQVAEPPPRNALKGSSAHTPHPPTGPTTPRAASAIASWRKPVKTETGGRVELTSHQEPQDRTGVVPRPGCTARDFWTEPQTEMVFSPDGAHAE